MAFVQNDIMSYAYYGTNLFSAEGELKDLYAVASLYPETCQIVARRNITGIAGLKGRRVSIGAEGSGTELNALQILESYGMKYTDINADHLGFSASVNAFRDGKIDAFFCTAGVPTPAVSQLTGGGEAHLLSIGDALARSIISQYPYYSRQIISAGTYPGIDEEAKTVAVKAALAVSRKLSEGTVEEIMKIMFENAPEISGKVPGATLSRESAADGLPIPLHPGAEKFFMKN
jgi:TRAP transporter TAXI family solute receptor